MLHTHTHRHTYITCLWNFINFWSKFTRLEIFVLPPLSLGTSYTNTLTYMCTYTMVYDILYILSSMSCCCFSWRRRRKTTYNNNTKNNKFNTSQIGVVIKKESNNNNNIHNGNDNKCQVLHNCLKIVILLALNIWTPEGHNQIPANYSPNICLNNSNKGKANFFLFVEHTHIRFKANKPRQLLNE